MKTILKIAVAAIALFSMLIADIPLLPLQLVPDAHAIFGVRRRAFIVGASVGAASATAASSEQAAAAQKQSATAQQQAAAAAHPAPPAASGKQLPLGTIVYALPAGCTSTPVGGVEYYYCGGNFYRAVFQGNALVYVTSQP